MTRAYANSAQSVLRNSSKFILQNMDRIDRVKVSKGESSEKVITSVERAIEADVTERLQALYPSHSVFCKHSGMIAPKKPSSDEPFVWVFDPLDGSENFMSSIPCYTMSLALFQNRNCVVGAVYQPILDELFVAIEGDGALMNGRKIRAHRPPYQNESLVMLTGQYLVMDALDDIESLTKRRMQISDVRAIGSVSLSLCYHARGNSDLFYARSVSIHQAAAGLLIAKEAGARVKTEQSNDVLIDRILSALPNKS